MKSKTLKALYITSALSLLFILLLAFSYPGKDLRLVIEEPDMFNEGWRIYDEDASSSSVSEASALPLRLPVEPGKQVLLERTLDEPFNHSQHLLIRGSLQDVTVFLDDDLLYERVFIEDESGLTLPVTSSWNLVGIPSHSEGKTLRIALRSPFEGMSGQINGIYIGSANHLTLFLIRTYGPGLLTTGLIFLVGLILTLSPILFRKIDHWEMGGVGLFAIFVSLYLLSEGRMLQFFTGNQFIIGSLAYITQSIFPIPLIIYMREVAHQRYRIVFNGFILAFAFNLAFITLLQLSGQQAFFESLWLTHTLIVIAVLSSVYIMGKEVLENSNSDAKRLLQGFSIMVFFGFLELIHFYFIDRVQVSSFIRIGILLFVITLTYHSIQRLSLILKRSLKAELYQKLAYTDQLTNAPNRMAFERDLEKLFLDDEEIEPITIGIFDLNNLKEINDTYGHKYGDSAIINTYDTLKGVFSEMGSCYRIGGDEFACFLKVNSDEAIEDLKEKLNHKVMEKNEKLFYPFVIAQGYELIPTDKRIDIDTLIHRADQNMYEDKEMKKTVSKVDA